MLSSKPRIADLKEKVQGVRPKPRKVVSNTRLIFRDTMSPLRRRCFSPLLVESTKIPEPLLSPECLEDVLALNLRAKANSPIQAMNPEMEIHRPMSRKCTKNLYPADLNSGEFSMCFKDEESYHEKRIQFLNSPIIQKKWQTPLKQLQK